MPQPRGRPPCPQPPARPLTHTPPPPPPPQISGKQIHLSLVANPSHLEAVNTVVLGKTRAKQYYADDTDRSANMGILLHGDGAFSGQGARGQQRGRGRGLERWGRGGALGSASAPGCCADRSLAACLSRRRACWARALGLLLARAALLLTPTLTLTLPACLPACLCPPPGIVYETLDMSGLPDYTTGGTIHLVVNNQVRGRAGGWGWGM